MVSRFSMYKLTKMKKILAWGELYDESSFICKFKKKCLLQKKKGGNQSINHNHNHFKRGDAVQ